MLHVQPAFKNLWRHLWNVMDVYVVLTWNTEKSNNFKIRDCYVPEMTLIAYATHTGKHTSSHSPCLLVAIFVSYLTMKLLLVGMSILWQSLQLPSGCHLSGNMYDHHNVRHVFTIAVYDFHVLFMFSLNVKICLIV